MDIHTAKANVSGSMAIYMKETSKVGIKMVMVLLSARKVDGRTPVSGNKAK